MKKITKGENPFPFIDIKRSFATAKKLAGIEDLHFHDLRRTAITRWLQQGTSLAFAVKVCRTLATANDNEALHSNR